MLSLYWLIPLGLFVMLIVVVAFFMSIKSGQYDDLDGPAHRILMDDNDPRIPNATNTQKTSTDSSSDS